MSVFCSFHPYILLESKRLAECIVNKGCEVDETPSVIPSYISTYGTLNILDDSLCNKLYSNYVDFYEGRTGGNDVFYKKAGNIFWSNIVVGDNLCNSFTSLNFTKYKHLESFIVGSRSFERVQTLSFLRNPLLSGFTVGNDAFFSVTYISVKGRNWIDLLMMNRHTI